MLIAFAVLQFVVGYWWWQGPWLDGTRTWIAGLLGFNGASALLKALVGWTGVQAFQHLSLFTDRWTNLFLLGVALVASDPLDAHRRERRIFLGSLGLLFLGAVPLRSFTRILRTPLRFFFTTTLFLAAAFTVVGLVRRTGSEAPEAGVWALVLSGVGFRYGELGVRFFHWSQVTNLSSPLPWGLDSILLRVGLPVAAFLASGVLAHRLRQETSEEARQLLLAALMLWVFGLLVGYARRTRRRRSPSSCSRSERFAPSSSSPVRLTSRTGRSWRARGGGR